jgi:hypothetical protein
VRLVIGGPTLGMVPAAFALDLAALYAKTLTAGPWTSVTLGFVVSTYVDVGREAVLTGALRWQATHVLWLDTDMTMPPDTAIRLASHNRPIVAANGVMRDPRLLCTAQSGGRRIETRPESTGLEAVDSVGMAVMLMRTDAVAGLARPWFRHGLTDAGEAIGEDITFCAALRATGHDILIDHDLSKEIGHIGQHTYRPRRETPLAI